MNSRARKSPVSLLVGLAAWAVTSSALAQTDLATVKSRMLADALTNAGFKAETEPYWGTDFSQADSYSSRLASNGSWSDIDYGDTSNEFPALKHLDRVLVLSYVYSKAGTSQYKSASVLSAISRALGYWYQVNPKCSNWFKNDIAKQYYLGPIGLLMQGAIDSSQLTLISNDLTAVPSMTGANKTAFSTSVIYRAVIEGNASRLTSGVNGVGSMIAVTSGDGVQRDFSFQQHGGILYNGNYGFTFLRDVTWVGSMLAGTQYAFSSSQIALLRDNYLEGTRWMLRGGLLDYNVRGREVGNNGGASLRGEGLQPILDHFIVIDPANQSAYQASKDNLTKQLPQAVSGTRHYWNSDYTAVQRPGYFSSVKMCSKRTIGMERDVNTENLLGYWLPYGLTYTYRRGDEYNYIFPVWDWARLPGVTNPHVEISFSDNSATYTSQSTSFVGAASDGSYAATAMDFSLEQTTAKKSWFWFDREWVALGAGIQSSHAKPIYTSIQQVLLKGSVIADGAAFSGTAKALTNPQWVLHDGVGYVFPEAQTVQIQAAPQTGSVKRIFGLGSSAAISANVFSLWFDHGTAPKGKTYQYVVVPGIEQAALDEYSKNLPIKVLSNTTSLQAAVQLKRRVTGAVFFQAGSLSVPSGPAVKVDVPCVVLLNEPAGTVAISDPSGSASKLTVTLTNVGGASKSQSVSLPGSDNAGKSVVVTGLLDKRPALEDGSGGTAGSAGGPGSAGTNGGAAQAGAGGTGENGGTGGSVASAGTAGDAGRSGASGGRLDAAGGSAPSAGSSNASSAGAPGIAGGTAVPAEPAPSNGCSCSLPGNAPRKSAPLLSLVVLGLAAQRVRRKRGLARA